MLVRMLGETHCRACGESWMQGAAAPIGNASVGTNSAGGLADEVEAALDRFFGRA
jgi:hypothetical protein